VYLPFNVHGLLLQRRKQSIAFVLLVLEWRSTRVARVELLQYHCTATADVTTLLSLTSICNNLVLLYSVHCTTDVVVSLYITHSFSNIQPS